MNLLECVGLKRTFGAFVAVDTVDLAVAEGSIHAVIGPNGAGKTTLFNLIAGTLGKTAGAVRLGGEDISSLSPHHVARRGVSRTFQITSLFPQLTVRENVRVAAQARLPGRWRFLGGGACRVESDLIARRWVERLGLGALADSIAGELSHGDQRLVEVALALAQSPRLLILDEPTQGMSVEETHHTVATLRNVLRETRTTVLLVEHDMDVVFALADRIAVLHRGRKIADDIPERVRANPDVQAAYLGEIE